MSIQTRAVARRKASYIESEDFIPDSAITFYWYWFLKGKYQGSGCVVAEVNVNRNRGFLTWGLGLLGMGTKKKKILA